MEDGTVALFANYSTELTETSSDEGIPHMRMFGIWARIILTENEIENFCRVYGYDTGQSVVIVRSYGGYVWSQFPPMECLQLGHRYEDCIDERLTLDNKWYYGPYVICKNSRVDHEPSKISTNG